jgi:hypothetical protein
MVFGGYPLRGSLRYAAPFGRPRRASRLCLAASGHCFASLALRRLSIIHIFLRHACRCEAPARERWKRTRRRNSEAMRAHLWCALRGWSGQRDGRHRKRSKSRHRCDGCASARRAARPKTSRLFIAKNLRITTSTSSQSP